MDKPRPYVTAALICEKILEDKDGTLSVIRIVDKLMYSVQKLPAGVKPAAFISALISIKSGPVVGAHILKVVAENPVGERKDVHSQTVNLLGRDQGQNLIVRMTLGIEHDGLFWFDVVFDEAVLTRIPFMVVQEQAPTPIG